METYDQPILDVTVSIGDEQKDAEIWIDRNGFALVIPEQEPIRVDIDRSDMANALFRWLDWETFHGFFEDKGAIESFREGIQSLRQTAEYEDSEMDPDEEDPSDDSETSPSPES